MSQTTNALVTQLRRFAAPAGLSLAVVVVASTMALHYTPVHAAALSAAPLDDSSVAALTALDQAMESLASRVTPAVVNVAVTSRAEEQAGDEGGGNGQRLPPGFGFGGGDGEGDGNGGRMQMAPQQPQLQRGIGSGVILSPDGYIVTNGHVVNGATQIKVTLHDRRVLTAKLVGADPLTDLAVIKVDAHDLPAMHWGDSSKLEPGQTVLAFGSPFGYFQFSVTRGIVSAVNRQNPYATDARKPGGYIQTDAAINPGNSGGALVNAHGELVGINTFIISDSGAFAGAGFAIPAQIARSATDQIIKTGSVHHGYLGISMNDVTPGNAQFFHLQEATGALVAQVTPDSPASRAGLKNGDVIDRLNGQRMENGGALQVAIAGITPGTKVQLGILRDGEPKTVDLTVGEYHSKEDVAANDRGEGGPENKGGRLGLAMADLTADIRQQLRVPETVKGAVIENVRAGSPAEDAGLRPGDVVTQVNRKEVDSASAVVAGVRGAPEGKDVLLLVWSRGGESYRVLSGGKG